MNEWNLLYRNRTCFVIGNGMKLCDEYLNKSEY